MEIVDHLFRHQYGKMVAILTRIFGLAHLETIEDAIQDTFINALQVWRTQMPENPEAWLTKAAKNRAIDLFRKIKAENNRAMKMESGSSGISGISAIHLNDLFLEHEMEDSQLRMIFTACHPVLNPKDQIAFALKTISGFGIREISAALLSKEETIKKRLIRARKVIAAENISFEIPNAKEMPLRLQRVLEVIYLTFNEGFHSNNPNKLIRKELCGEAIRLCRLLLKKEALRKGPVYALFALMCFHTARLESRVNEAQEIMDLKNQDRTKWHFPLMSLGNQAMTKATSLGNFSVYHFEAAIAAEHLKARSFEETDWATILHWYEKLYELQASPFTLLNQSIVLLQLERGEEAKEKLDQLDPKLLAQRAYLYYGTLAEYYIKKEEINKALSFLDQAIDLVKNEREKAYLINKKMELKK